MVAGAVTATVLLPVSLAWPSAWLWCCVYNEAATEAGRICDTGHLSMTENGQRHSCVGRIALLVA